MDQRFDDPLVPLIEAIAIDLEHGERAVGEFGGDFSFSFHLHIVAHPAQKIVCGAWRAACASGDLSRARRFNFDTEQSGAADNDLLHLLGVVIVESRAHAEARAQRCADHAGARSRADEGELRQI